MQAILTDPYINNLLKDMQTNPQAAQRAMSDSRVAGQIEKLMIAGVCSTWYGCQPLSHARSPPAGILSMGGPGAGARGGNADD